MITYGRNSHQVPLIQCLYNPNLALYYARSIILTNLFMNIAKYVIDIDIIFLSLSLYIYIYLYIYMHLIVM